MIEPEAELPKWQSHKVVGAAQIERITKLGPSGLYRLDLSGNLHVHVTYAYYAKHTPYVGGYFVRYADGYESFSPAQAFEEGYERVT